MRRRYPVFNENDPHWEENILNPPDVIFSDESSDIQIDATDGALGRGHLQGYNSAKTIIQCR
jgi:hypothetical protein